MRLLTILILIATTLIFLFSNVINQDHQLVEQSEPRDFVRRTGPSGCTYIPGGTKQKMCQIPPPPPLSHPQPSSLHRDSSSRDDSIPCDQQAPVMTKKSPYRLNSMILDTPIMNS